MKRCLIPFLFFGTLFAAHDPFSKITVKSQKAVFQKESAESKNIARLQYSKDVRVTFADKTTVSSDLLEVFVKSELNPPVAGGIKTDKKSQVDVQRVVFKNNVCMKRLNQTVQADEIEVVVSKKMCELRGNVKIEQVKKKDGDVPLITECENAKLRWDCEEIELIGSETQPVSTTIELAGNMRKLQKKKGKA